MRVGETELELCSQIGALRLHYDCVNKDPLISAGGSSWFLLPSWASGPWLSATGVPATPSLGTFVSILNRKKNLLPCSLLN